LKKFEIKILFTGLRIAAANAPVKAGELIRVDAATGQPVFVWEDLI